MYKRILVALLMGLGLLWPSQQCRADIAEIVFVVDESGSMGGEHAWLGGMVAQLEAKLNTKGYTGKYGLVGFGSSNPNPRQINVGGGQFGTAAQFATATGSLLLNGGFEDGWAGITFGLDYTFTAGSKRNIILVTDEDRDNLGGIYGAITKLSLIADLNASSAILNSVVDATFSSNALGIAADGTRYVADGIGGYTTVVGAAGSGYVTGFGGINTKDHYIDPAWATGGAGWDLNKLRAGGQTAVSFTNAFIDLKIQEIVDVPVPAGIWMAAIGIVCVAGYRRFGKRTALA